MRERKVQAMEYKFTDQNFEAEVLQSELPVLVDFYADWCGPCKMMAPLVKELAEKYEGKIRIGKLNIDENLDTAQKYRVMSIPTFIVFKNGEKVDSTMGAVPKSGLEAMIERVLA